MPHSDNLYSSQWKAYVQCIDEGHNEYDEDNFTSANTVPTIETNEFQQFHFIKACNLIVDLQVKTKWVEQKKRDTEEKNVHAHTKCIEMLKSFIWSEFKSDYFRFFFRSLKRLSRVLQIWITTKYTQSFRAHVLHKTLSSENILLKQKQFLGTCARACACARARSLIQCTPKTMESEWWMVNGEKQQL